MPASDGMHRQSVQPHRACLGVWGRVPPPVGGMAVHLERLLPYLEDAGFSVQMYSVGRRTPHHPGVKQVSGRRLLWLLGLLIRPREPVHYVFSADPAARFAAGLLARLGRAHVVLRVGSWRGDASGWRGRMTNALNRFAFRSASAVVGVSEEICRRAESAGAKHVVHIPGFIPPRDVPPNVPLPVASFLDTGTGAVVLASGEVREPENDLYGAYALLDLVEAVPDIRILFFAYRVTYGTEPQERLAEAVRKRGLESRFFMYHSGGDLVSAMRRCQLLLRPTLSDGDSNSVREALHMGLPVVASDCVARPAGVVTFATGDAEAMQCAVVAVLSDLEGHRAAIRSSPQPDNAGAVVALLRGLVESESNSGGDRQSSQGRAETCH